MKNLKIRMSISLLSILLLLGCLIALELVASTGKARQAKVGRLVSKDPLAILQERLFRTPKKLPCCQWDEKILVGKLAIEKEKVDLATMQEKDPFLKNVKDGGQWHPENCQARAKVAIIVPFRNRGDHLPVLLRQLHPILQRQQLDYRIFVISQEDKNLFNRAKLFNIGFNEVLKYDDYDCFVFHDVDLIPENDKNDYGCPTSPRHMCPAVNKFNYVLFSPRLFGGITSFRKKDFVGVNGFSNKYYGWGSEDDDMYSRVTGKGMTVTRPALQVGRYTMILHKKKTRNEKSLILLKTSVQQMDKDGLNTLKYKLVMKQSFPFYTKICADLEMTDEEKKFSL